MGASGNRTPSKISLYLLFVKDQVIEIVLLRCALEQEYITRLEKRARAGLRSCAPSAMQQLSPQFL